MVHEDGVRRGRLGVEARTRWYIVAVPNRLLFIGTVSDDVYTGVSARGLHECQDGVEQWTPGAVRESFDAINSRTGMQRTCL